MLEIDEINSQLDELGVRDSEISKETGLTKGWISNFRNKKQSSKIGRAFFSIYIKLKKIERIVADNNKTI